MIIVMKEDLCERQKVLLQVADSYPESSKVFTLFGEYLPGIRANRETMALHRSTEWNTKERYRLCHAAQMHAADVLVIDDIRMTELCMYTP